MIDSPFCLLEGKCKYPHIAAIEYRGKLTRRRKANKSAFPNNNVSPSQSWGSPFSLKVENASLYAALRWFCQYWPSVLFVDYRVSKKEISCVVFFANLTRRRVPRSYSTPRPSTRPHGYSPSLNPLHCTRTTVQKCTGEESINLVQSTSGKTLGQ
jgi:hypothetical protein